MSTFQVLPGKAGIKAIERDETRAIVSIQTFATQLAARRWVLGRVDESVRAEQAMIRAQILSSRARATAQAA